MCSLYRDAASTASQGLFFFCLPVPSLSSVSPAYPLLPVLVCARTHPRFVLLTRSTPFSCTSCQIRCLDIVYQHFSFARSSTMTDDDSSYNFHCPLNNCSRWFKNLTGLTQHIQAKHPNEGVDVNMSTLPDYVGLLKAEASTISPSK